MSTSFYDMSVASYLQTVDAVGGFLDKGLDHCQGCSTDPGRDGGSAAGRGHAAAAVPDRVGGASFARRDRGHQGGVFSPPGKVEPLDYAGLQKMMADTARACSR